MCTMLRGAFAYLAAAFKEALRLFPTAPTLMRRLDADMRLGPYALHKREVVAVAVYSMHRNPAYWQVSSLWRESKPLLGSSGPNGPKNAMCILLAISYVSSIMNCITSTMEATCACCA